MGGTSATTACSAVLSLTKPAFDNSFGERTKSLYYRCTLDLTYRSANGQTAALIIGAGPAGLTAALELLRRTEVQPIILEASHAIGGLSRTVQYKGNRMDIGGHRFFSKSNRVMQWWLDIMPLDSKSTGAIETDSLQIHYQGKQWEMHGLTNRNTTSAATVAPPDPDLVMLIRPRKSRIYFLRRFFDYPIRLTAGTLLNLGLCGHFGQDLATCALLSSQNGKSALWKTF